MNNMYAIAIAVSVGIALIGAAVMGGLAVLIWGN